MHFRAESPQSPLTPGGSLLQPITTRNVERDAVRNAGQLLQVRAGLRGAELRLALLTFRRAFAKSSAIARLLKRFDGADGADASALREAVSKLVEAWYAEHFAYLARERHRKVGAALRRLRAEINRAESIFSLPPSGLALKQWLGAQRKSWKGVGVNRMVYEALAALQKAAPARLTPQDRDSLSVAILRELTGIKIKDADLLLSQVRESRKKSRQRARRKRTGTTGTRR